MIAVTALRIAGPGALLVRRPHGVPHVYVGPTTPSGRFIPRAGRSVCRAHTRRLGVIPRDALPADARVCARCTSRLARQPRPVTRDDYLARFSHLTYWDLYAEAQVASTDRWLDAVAHVSLVVLGHRGCDKPPAGAGPRVRSLHDLIGQRRRALNPELDQTDARLRAHGEVARAARAGERAEIYKQAQARIERLGINLAKPVKK